MIWRVDKKVYLKFKSGWCVYLRDMSRHRSNFGEPTIRADERQYIVGPWELGVWNDLE